MEEQYHFVTYGIDTYFHKDVNDKDKYIVCTCAKNENEYIREFIEHYLLLGFDKIIICDNNDDTSLLNVINDYIERGVVEVFDCRGFGGFQVQFYTYFCKEGNYKWCAYFDADEFLELNCYSNIKQFLETIKEDCICFNWMMFGPNGQIRADMDKSLQERFTTPVYPLNYFKENLFYKSIVRGGKGRFSDAMSFNGSHIPAEEGKIYNIGGMYTTSTFVHCAYPPRYKCGYLKHYYTKSFDEWLIKSNRGWPDGTANLKTSRFFMFENSQPYPLGLLTDTLFADEFNKEKAYEENKYVLETFDIIQIVYPESEQIYAMINGMTRLMLSASGKTYVFTDNKIDDTLYNFFLEIALITGNRVVFARNINEIWGAYMKYNTKPTDTYYIIKYY